MSSVAPDPSRVTVTSPEGVELELLVASPSLRMAAYTIDLVLLSVGIIGLFFMLALGWAGQQLGEAGEAFTRGDQGAANAALAPILGLVTVFLYFSEIVYFSVWELLSGGRSLGKYLVGLRVVGLDGRAVSARAVGIRNLLRFADMLPSSYLAGLVAMVVSARGQRLGDHAAGTLVVRTDRGERAAAVELPAHVQPLALSRAQLQRLGQRELQLARSTLRRAASLDRDATDEPDTASRGLLLERSARALARALGTGEQGLAEPELFLQRVVRTGERRS